MKEYVKKRKPVSKRIPSSLIIIAKQIICGVIGFLASEVNLLGKLTPLGVAFTASVPTGFSLISGIGAFLGYLFSGNAELPLRYVASLFATVSIRLLTVGLKKLADAPPFNAFVVLTSVTVCNAVTFVNSGNNMLLLLCEGVLAGGITYFASIAITTNYIKGVGLTGEELASAIITLDLVLISLVPISVMGFSIGRTVTVALILAAARFGSTTGGAVAGTSVGVAAALCEAEPKLLCLYAVCGMFGGLFSSSRLLTSLGFSVPYVIMLAMFGINSNSFVLIIEMLFGTAIFLLLQKNVCAFIAAFFAPPVKIESLEGMRKSLVMRLKYASCALSDVSSTIDIVAQKLKRINGLEPPKMFKQLEETTCNGCSFRITCWETDHHETYKALGLLAKSIREGGGSIFDVVPNFAGKCLKPKDVEENLKRIYGEYNSKIAANERIESIRGVVADQFDGISDMLLDLSEEFENSRIYDLDIAEKVVIALRELGYITTDCGCSTDKFGRMTVEAKLHTKGSMPPNRKKIMDALIYSCERNFDAPILSGTEECCFLTATERANFAPEIGIAQASATETGICGDAYTYFGDGYGRYFVVLSDGMGTGGRAAVDGAMTVGLTERLIKAGFGFDCTLKIVNSAIAYKSCEESLATLDISSVDLYTGEAGIFKAGAAPSFVKKNGKVGKAESRSLPIGILRDVGFDRTSVMLKSEDVIVLLSDGVTNGPTDWIKKEIELFDGVSAQQLADNICDCALRRQTEMRKDDITVITLILKNNL